MSEPAPSEPHPFQKFVEFARRIISVPKSEADKKEKEWRDGRSESKRGPKTKR